jgi:hypothetical protein
MSLPEGPKAMLALYLRVRSILEPRTPRLTIVRVHELEVVGFFGYIRELKGILPRSRLDFVHTNPKPGHDFVNFCIYISHFDFI